jgi:hypothetical protein
VTPRLRAVLRTLLFFGCAAGALAPALARPHDLANRYDWRYFESMGEIARRDVLWYHQAPLWNPYSCGGEVDLANPQSLSASPTFLLVLLFGVALGYKLTLLVFYFCATDGAFRFARRLGVSEGGSILAGLGYGLSGYFALHFSEGHLTFVGAALFPYLVLFYDRAVDALEWSVPTGAVAAEIALMGGTFTPAMGGELLVIWAGLVCYQRRSLRPLWPLLIGAVVALLLGAARMFPVLQFVYDHPRPPFMRQPDVSWPWRIVTDLTAWRLFGPVAGRKYWSHEYTARLPYLLAPLWAVMVFYWGWSRRRLAALEPGVRWSIRRLCILALVGMLLTMGNFAVFAPWSLLQKFRVLRDLRVPSRHIVLMTLALTPLAGFGWDFLGAWLRRRRSERLWRSLTVAAILVTALDGTIYTALQYRDIFVMPAVGIRAPQPFYHADGTWRTMRDHLFAGHGSYGCDEEAPLQRAHELDLGDVPQERLLDPAAGEILKSEWTPNRRVITVRLDRPTALLINSNWNEHWKSDLGRVSKLEGRLAVDLSAVPAGTHVVTLRYAPRVFPIGVAVSALAIPLLFIGFGLITRRR